MSVLGFLRCWFGPISTYGFFSFLRGLWVWLSGRALPGYWPICVVRAPGLAASPRVIRSGRPLWSRPRSRRSVCFSGLRPTGQSRPARLALPVCAPSFSVAWCSSGVGALFLVLSVPLSGPALAFPPRFGWADSRAPLLPPSLLRGAPGFALGLLLSRLPFALPPALRPRPRLPSCLVVGCVFFGAWSAGFRVPGPPFLPSLSRSLALLATPARLRSLPGLIWLGHSPGFSSDRRPACGLSAVRAFCRWGTARC